MTEPATDTDQAPGGHEMSPPGAVVPRVVVVIPAFKASSHIGKVVAGLPAMVRDIVIVDDASPDGTVAAVRQLDDPRVHLVCHAQNQGVGGAMLTGYRKAVELGADVMVKMDSDGQMDPQHLPALLAPVIHGEADYAKGNRFVHANELRDMPLVRRIGNVGLSFLSKLASGCWSVFDPTNGYTALHRTAFQRLDQGALARRYFFESSMLIELGLAGAVIQDVDIPASYSDETSHLSPVDSLLVFPRRLLRGFLRRIWVQHFVRNFGLFALFMVTGFSLLAYGLTFGIGNWIYYSLILERQTPLGTIMLAVLPIILGVQFVLQALLIDVQDQPRQSLQAERARVAAAELVLARAAAAGSLVSVPRPEAPVAGQPADQVASRIES